MDPRTHHLHGMRWLGRSGVGVAAVGMLSLQLAPPSASASAAGVTAALGVATALVLARWLPRGAQLGLCGLLAVAALWLVGDRLAAVWWGVLPGQGGPEVERVTVSLLALLAAMAGGAGVVDHVLARITRDAAVAGVGFTLALALASLGQAADGSQLHLPLLLWLGLALAYVTSLARASKPLNSLERLSEVLLDLAAGVSLVALLGWLLQCAAVVQGGTHYLPMVFNTALGSLAMAVSWRLSALGRRRLALLAVSLSIAVALGALLDELSGRELFAQLLWTHRISAEDAAPGRVAMSTALLLGVLSVGAVCDRQVRRHAVLSLLVWLGGAVAVVVGVLMLAGCWLDLRQTRILGGQTPMALNTAIAMTCIGLAVSLRGVIAGERRRWQVAGLPLVVALLVALATARLWLAVLDASSSPSPQDFGGTTVADLVMVAGLVLAVMIGLLLRLGLLARASRWTEQRVAASLQRQNDILHMLAMGAPRERVLAAVATLLQEHFAGAAISVASTIDGHTRTWSLDEDAGWLALHADFAQGASLAGHQGWLRWRDATQLCPHWSDPSRALSCHGLWVEVLLDGGGARVGELLIALAQRGRPQAPEQTVIRAATSIAGLVFQRDAAVARMELGRERYRSLVDNHPDAVMHIDAEGHIDEANEASILVFGRSLEQLKASPLRQLVDASVSDALQMRMQTVQIGRAQSLDVLTAPIAGRGRELELILIPLGARARSSGMFVVARDVTRFRASERALRRTYERSMLRRDQLLELNHVSIASAAIEQIDELLEYLARIMCELAGVEWVRLGVDPSTLRRFGADASACVVARASGITDASALPAQLRADAAQLHEPQQRVLGGGADSNDSEPSLRNWLAMGLVDDAGAFVGTIEWFNTRDNEFAEDDEVLLVQFARLMVGSLQRAWLHQHLREAERNIAHQLAFVRAMAASIGEGLYAIDPHGQLTFMNDAARNVLRWNDIRIGEREAEKAFLSIEHGDNGPATQAMRENRRVQARVSFVASEGEPVPVDLVASPLSLGGEVVGAVVVFRDVTEKLRAEEARLERDRFFALSLELFVITDHSGRLLQFNEATYRLLRRSAADVAQTHWRDHVHPDDLVATESVLAQIFTAGRIDAFVNRWVDANGDIHWLEWAISSAPDQRVYAVARDITERRRYENELAHYATHDAVTGLPRVEQVEAFLISALAAAALRGARVSVFYLDLDRFHLINDSRGHAIGDEVLRAVAHRLHSSVGEHGRVARISGDEFLIVRVDDEDGPDQEELGEALRVMIEKPIDLVGQQVFLTCSVGVSCFPDNGTAARELMRQSEAAMARAKDEGRNAVASFSNDELQALKDRLELGSSLRKAIANNELVLHFQPQISAHNWQVSGVEALVRWNSPTLGLLLPGRFIPVAEELGMIVELGQWVLESACRKAKEWLDSGLADFTVAVNVSALQLQRPDFLERVQRALEVSRLPPRFLELELTESMVMAHVERVIVAMRSLKALGVNMSLDDFGSGYSSLNYLRRFPIDKLKIDTSFVRDIITDPGSAGICRAVIALGHQLGMTVSAEGVETIGQAAFLRRNECDQFQGNYFSVPMPAAQTFDVLRRRYLRQEEMGVTLAKQESTETLLLLDDEENVLRALVRLLRRDGYQIETATCAQQAFEILAAHPVQVIISDQRMPDISGTDFLGRVKDLYPDTVRLILSGYSDFASLTEAINRGSVYRYVAKPWDDEELRRMVREAFRIADARRGAGLGIGVS